MTSKPRWRQVFDKVERKVGAPLEDVAASNRFVGVMSVGIKVRRATGGTVRRAVHGATGKVLHAVNIPTQDDVKRLSTNLSALAGEIRAIEQGQRVADNAVPPVRATTRPATARSTKSPSAPRAAKGGHPAEPGDD